MYLVRPVMRAAVVTMAIAWACASVVGALGCRHSPVQARGTEAGLPTVGAATEGSLFTWIDDKGDFHVETRVSDVPLMGRDTVRVVDPAVEGAPADEVFVTDLRQIRPDGTYPVRTMPRSDFEALAVARRQEAGPTMAGAAPPSNVAEAPPVPDTPSAKPAARGGVVVIYGAEWCGACHDAARYLRRKGIAYVEKDIEKDQSAAREMQQKLAKNGLRGGSIPVIDVRGKIMVGFNLTELEAILGEPL